MRFVRPFALLLCCVGFLPVHGHASDAGDGYPQVRVAFADGVTGLPALTYASEAGFRPLTLDLYLPPPRFEGPRPLVIFVHGGGWAIGTPKYAAVYRNWPERLAGLAARGYVVAAPSYRLSGEARFPAAFHDIQASIRWLRSNAQAFGVDRERVLIWGESAGGHLAALVAARCEDPARANGESACVQGAVVWYGISDLLSQDFGDMDRNFLGCAVGCDELRRQASPVHRVGPDAAPFLILHGTADRVVPYRQAQLLQQALERREVPARLLTLEGIDHSFIGHTPAQTQKVGEQALRETFAFIEQLLPAQNRVDAEE